MIGKFLQDEENKPAENDEIKIFEAVENNPSAPFVLKDDPQSEVLNIPANTEQEPMFEQSAEVNEAFALPENQEHQENRQVQEFQEFQDVQKNQENQENQIIYTVAPPDALVSDSIESYPKTEVYEETTAENLRRTGLAWSAATVLGGSIIFMLILGWFFDLVFGSKPWGIVGGIVLGAIIGFIQFFRITSQIFKKNDNNSLGI